MVLLQGSKDQTGRLLPKISFAKCLAKLTEDLRPGQTVESHSLVVGELARALRQRLPDVVRRQLPDGLVVLAALHDLGKISPGFQKSIQGSVEAILRTIGRDIFDLGGMETKHAGISEASLNSWLGKQNASKSLKRWAEVLGLHHGDRNKLPLDDAAISYGGESWQRERHVLLGRLLQRFGPLPSVPPTSEIIQLAAGFVCVCDWIGSNEEFFPEGKLEKLTAESDLAQLAGAALDAAGWTWPTIRAGLSFEELFGPENRFTPTPVQRAVVDAAATPGVFVVESLMGTGKTEAALAGAYRLLESGQNNGLYFALPTRLTSDRIYERLKPFVTAVYGENAAVKLSHGLEWLQRRESDDDESQPPSVASWFQPAKRGLLWPLGVGTIDQSLLSILNVKHNYLRAFGLAGKVVILDEVHSYDMYTGTLLDELVKMLRKIGCSVFILSATLTQKRRQEFFPSAELPATNEYPLLTAEPGRCEPIPRPPASVKPLAYHVEHVARESDHPEQLEQLTERVAERVAQGQAVLWIANTVAEAQRCYRAAKSSRREGDGPLGLLHSAFPPWRRTQLEKEWMERLGKTAPRDGGSLLISTQVVEQSVDIDADLLVTDLAPTDMLFQRMGRVWRHRQRRDRKAERAEAWIVEPRAADYADAEEFCEALGPSGFVYSPYVLWRSWQVWRERTSVTVPDELREMLEATYREQTYREQGPNSNDSPEPAWIDRLREECLERRQRLSGIARAMTDNRNPTLSDRDAHTRYSTTPTYSFLLAKEIETLGKNTRVVFSDDCEVSLNARWCDKETAKVIHENMIALRAGHRVPRPAQTPRWLQPAVRGEVGVLRIDPDDGRLLQVDGEPTELGYHNDIGVYNFDLPEARKETYDNELDW